MHRRSDSEPEAMLGAYAGPCRRGLEPSWLRLGSNLAILAVSGAILAPTWPSWPDLGSLLGNLRLPLGS